MSDIETSCRNPTRCPAPDARGVIGGCGVQWSGEPRTFNPRMPMRIRASAPWPRAHAPSSGKKIPKSHKSQINQNRTIKTIPNDNSKRNLSAMGKTTHQNGTSESVSACVCCAGIFELIGLASLGLNASERKRPLSVVLIHPEIQNCLPSIMHDPCRSGHLGCTASFSRFSKSTPELSRSFINF